MCVCIYEYEYACIYTQNWGCFCIAVGYIAHAARSFEVIGRCVSVEAHGWGEGGWGVGGPAKEGKASEGNIYTHVCVYVCVCVRVCVWSSK